MNGTERSLRGLRAGRGAIDLPLQRRCQAPRSTVCSRWKRGECYGPCEVSTPLDCLRCGAHASPSWRFCQRCGARLGEAAGDPLLGGVLLGRYRVLRVLGEGTMGRVYLGEQRVGESSRLVAIKVLAATRGNDDYLIARFRREAATIASLEHPNIIRLYDYGEEGGRFFSVMEYVPGGSLASLLAKGRLAPARVEAIVWQIASALDAAHRKGIVHRDLKPENVLLASTQEGPDGVDTVKVVDFGIARRPPSTPDERPLTLNGAMLGTPAYMSPEQFLGMPSDARSDVYALALVTYQMLVGALPWEASSVTEWGEAQMHRAPRPLRSWPGMEVLPERYEMAIARALVKDVSRRTDSAIAFAREFSGRASPEAVQGPAGPSTVRDVAPTPAEEVALAPIVPRWRWPVLIVMGTVLLLAAGLVGLLQRAIRGVRRLDDAKVSYDASSPAMPAASTSVDAATVVASRDANTADHVASASPRSRTKVPHRRAHGLPR